MSPTKDNRIASTDATPAPMDPERLAELRGWLTRGLELLADRDRLDAKVKSLEAEHATALDRAYDDGWSEGLGSAGVDFGGAGS